MGRKKLPANPRHRQQVQTFSKRYGRQAYSKIGSEGGKKSPTKFDSERARAASLKYWADRRAKEAAEAAERKI